MRVFPRRPGRISAPEAARRLGVSQSTIYRWCSERRIGHYQVAKGCHVWLTEEDLAVFAEQVRKDAEGDWAAGMGPAAGRRGVQGG